MNNLILVLILGSLIGSSFCEFPIEAKNDIASVKFAMSSTSIVATFAVSMGTPTLTTDGGAIIVCGTIAEGKTSLSSSTLVTDGFAYQLNCINTALGGGSDLCKTAGSPAVGVIKAESFTTTLTYAETGSVYGYTSFGGNADFSTPTVAITGTTTIVSTAVNTYTAASDALTAKAPSVGTEGLRCYYAQVATALVATAAVTDLAADTAYTLITSNSAVYTATAAIAGLFLQVLY
mmetsp:Transcript_25101/g.27857  ORF Transcript_25101/g.27857 Transcript_25101/m.27857 type:complete len:234 (-) Transcript_25101:91-792(-)|eukprot:CAMPEP_0205820786 /NCGR_PEP_ID=MMETSP0206-20130828/3431_1 /ASSEMBLY_ACC=CAM_ASM_000279 /TAXON_ID=36767 /ORGANISM="Euplotes focardii, Strain TN1" /LENGTH=233 /DNA_ID=CAMNT_0053115827 /DNA_START=60 /DNA_END=761 /DNA_ORIENTATION=-